MRILLTGGTGFIGEYVLSLLLERGHEILSISRDARECRPEVHWLQSEMVLNDSAYRVIEEFMPAVVINLAWQGIPDLGRLNSEKNVEISIKFVTRILTLPSVKRCVGIGSCLEYQGLEGACREDAHVDPASWFAWAKYCSYHYMRRACLEADKEFTWLRLFYVYGPGQRSASLIPSIISDLSTGKAPYLQTPHSRKDFIFVGDVARGVCMAAEKTYESGVYNLGSGSVISVAEICHKVEEALTGKTSIMDAQELKQPKIPDRPFWADISKARNALDWGVDTSLMDGIRATCNLAGKN